jgi:ferredoxin
MCTGTAPELFELDAAHRSRPRVPTVDDQSPVWEAAESCPVEAITLHDAATGQELFPAD